MTQSPPPRFTLDALRQDQEYAKLRRALVQFFRWNGSPDPEDHTSETILRVYNNYANHVQIHNLEAYVYGIAQHVLNEHWREMRSAEGTGIPSATPVDETLLQSVEECMKTCLSSQERKLITAYYADETSAQIRHREKLAKRLDLTVETLRIRAHRIRRKLESCLRKCGEIPSASQTNSRFRHREGGASNL